MPAASLSTTEIAPEGCAATDVAEYVPLAATGTEAVVPSGKVTTAVEPGSPVPETVSVPLGFTVLPTVGANGAVVSVKAEVTGVEVLPAASLSTAVTLPEGWAASDVAV